MTDEPDTIARLPQRVATQDDVDRQAWLLGQVVEMRRLVGTVADRLAELEERITRNPPCIL